MWGRGTGGGGGGRGGRGGRGGWRTCVVDCLHHDALHLVQDRVGEHGPALTPRSRQHKAAAHRDVPWQEWARPGQTVGAAASAHLNSGGTTSSNATDGMASGFSHTPPMPSLPSPSLSSFAIGAGPQAAPRPAVPAAAPLQGVAGCTGGADTGRPGPPGCGDPAAASSAPTAPVPAPTPARAFARAPGGAAATAVPPPGTSAHGGGGHEDAGPAAVSSMWPIGPRGAARTTNGTAIARGRRSAIIAPAMVMGGECCMPAPAGPPSGRRRSWVGGRAGRAGCAAAAAPDIASVAEPLAAPGHARARPAAGLPRYACVGPVSSSLSLSLSNPNTAAKRSIRTRRG